MRPTTRMLAPVLLFLLLAVAAAVQAQLRVEDVQVDPPEIMPGQETANVSFTVRLDCQALLLYGGAGDVEAALEYALDPHVTVDLPGAATLPSGDCAGPMGDAEVEVQGTLDVQASAPGLTFLINRVTATVDPAMEVGPIEPLSAEQRIDVLARYMRDLQVRVLEENITVGGETAVAPVELVSRSNAQARWSLQPVSVSFDGINESVGLVQVPTPVVLGTPNNPDEREPLEAVMTVRLEIPAGAWREARVEVELQDAPTFRPEQVGEPIPLQVVFRNPAAGDTEEPPEDEESPGPAGVFLAAGVLGAAWAVARRRQGQGGHPTA